MTCIKTGAHIYLVPYREFVYGDAFELEPAIGNDHERKVTWRALYRNSLHLLVKDFAYFHLCARSREPINGLEVVHYIVHDWDHWFNSGDFSAGRAIQLNKSFMMTNNFECKTILISDLKEATP